MIDSTLVEERIEGMIGIGCEDCLDTGFVQEYRDGIGWCMIFEVDPIKDGEGKEVRRMKICTHGKSNSSF
jgi:hypothetical protein